MPCPFTVLAGTLKKRSGLNGVWAWKARNLSGRKFIIRNSAIRNSQLETVLPDGYIIETSPAAGNWWHQAASVLEHGRLMAIDYGFTADEMFSPSRTSGTLRAYFRHHVTDDLLANVGEQDITAHVNFSGNSNHW